MAIKSKARHDLTLRSIKREIAAGRDVAYWLDKAYTHLDSGLLTFSPPCGDCTEIESYADECDMFSPPYGDGTDYDFIKTSTNQFSPPYGDGTWILLDGFSTPRFSPPYGDCTR